MTDNSRNKDAVPSAGYTLTLVLACVGIAFLGISVGGGLIARRGGEPMDAMDVDGIITFLLAFAILFASRLIFWRKAAPRVRETVRRLITASLLAGFVATLLSGWLAFVGRDKVGSVDLPISFTLMAALCQTASVAWLARYRGEGCAVTQSG